MLLSKLIKIFLTMLIALTTVNSESITINTLDSDSEGQFPSLPTPPINSRKVFGGGRIGGNRERPSEGMDCIDPTLIHNLKNNIIEVPSRFEKIRNCRKSNGVLISLVGNKGFKYGYNLKDRGENRLIELLQTRPRCSLESTTTPTIQRIFCPTRKPNGPWISLADFLLCDDVKNCPNGEDENELFCHYHKSMKRELQAKFIQSTLIPESSN